MNYSDPRRRKRLRVGWAIFDALREVMALNGSLACRRSGARSRQSVLKACTVPNGDVHLYVDVAKHVRNIT